MRRGNGDGSIFLLRGKRRNPYAVRITVGWTNEGKQQYKYLGYYRTKTEAKRALDLYNTNPYDLMNKDVTLIEVYEKWQRQTNLGESVMKNYKSAFNKCYQLHSRKMRDIKASDLKSQLDFYSPTTKKMYKMIMNHLYKYAIENEIVEKNLSEFITYDTVESKSKSVFSSDEIQKLWDNLDNDINADIPLILLYSGMRIGELLDIKSDDVFIDDDYMIGGLKTAAGRNRVIPIHHKIKPLIEKRLTNKNLYLITDKRGKQINYNAFARRQWTKVVENHTAHETRHTFITQMDRLNVNKVALKKIVGHSLKEDITDHYTHKSIQELVDTVNLLEY